MKNILVIAKSYRHFSYFLHQLEVNDVIDSKYVNVIRIVRREDLMGHGKETPLVILHGSSSLENYWELLDLVNKKRFNPIYRNDRVFREDVDDLKVQLGTVYGESLLKGSIKVIQRMLSIDELMKKMRRRHV